MSKDLELLFTSHRIKIPQNVKTHLLVVVVAITIINNSHNSNTIHAGYSLICYWSSQCHSVTRAQEGDHPLPIQSSGKHQIILSNSLNHPNRPLI